MRFFQTNNSQLLTCFETKLTLKHLENSKYYTFVSLNCLCNAFDVSKINLKALTD